MKFFKSIVNFSKLLFSEKYKNGLEKLFEEGYKQQDTEKMKQAVELGYDLNLHFEANLSYASFENKVKVVEFLFDHIKIKNFKKILDLSTPLNPICSACTSNSVETLKFILNYSNCGSYVDCLPKDEDIFKFCYSEGKLELIKYFIFERNIDINKDLKKWLEEKHGVYNTKGFYREFTSIPNRQEMLNIISLKQLNQNLQKKTEINKAPKKNENYKL